MCVCLCDLCMCAYMIYIQYVAKSFCNIGKHKHGQGHSYSMYTQTTEENIKSIKQTIFGACESLKTVCM